MRAPRSVLRSGLASRKYQRRPPALWTAGCSPPWVAEVSEVVMRPMAEIEAEVRAALSALPEVWGRELVLDGVFGGSQSLKSSSGGSLMDQPPDSTWKNY